MNNIIRTIKNVVKHNIAKNLNVDIMNIELSNTYISFFDKLEKSNNTYENVIEIENVDLDYIHNGQVEIILRALELYKYNLNYMLDTEKCSDTERQEKLAMIQFTFEQVLSIQAEQVNGKSVDTETTSSQFSKAMLENNLLEEIITIDKNFKVCRFF